MNKNLVNKVLEDLKGVVPYKEDVEWKDFKSIKKLGYYHVKENTIYLNEYLADDEQELLNTIAHELIHSAGVHNHGKEFKKYMNLINSLNLGYKVSVHYEGGKDFKTLFKQKQAEYRASRPKYLVYCTECDFKRVYNFKHHDISRYRCKCRGKLKQRKVEEE